MAGLRRRVRMRSREEEAYCRRSSRWRMTWSWKRRRTWSEDIPPRAVAVPSCRARLRLWGGAGRKTPKGEAVAPTPGKPTSVIDIGSLRLSQSRGVESRSSRRACRPQNLCMSRRRFRFRTFAFYSYKLLAGSVHDFRLCCVDRRGTCQDRHAFLLRGPSVPNHRRR